MKERLLRVAKWIAFPAFYLFCLGLFGYLSFPYDRLKDRIVAELEKRGKPGQRIEIGKLTSYWFTGVELTQVKLHLPPDDATPLPGAEPGAAKEAVLTIDEAHVRVRVLPLLIGRVRVDFWASAFGGEIKGTAPVGDGKGDVEIEIEHVDIGKIDPIVHAVGVPLKGSATGKLFLTAPEGKFNKANGTFELTVAGAVVSDGKTKIQGLIELPPAKLGDIKMEAEAKDGVLKISKLTAAGTDLELVGDGKLTLREPWSDAVADLYLRFKFTDAYRGKNGTTKSLLGEPGSSTPGLIEMQVPKMKRAKRPDGFYGWHIHGALKKLRYDPTTSDAANAPASPAKRGKGADSPFGAPPRRPTPSLPLGPSTAIKPPEPAVAKPPEPPEPPPAPAIADPPSRRGAAPEVLPTVPPLQPAPPPAPEPAPEAPAQQPEPVPEQPQ